MAYETAKTNKLRGRRFMRNYFRGRVIDIGAGDDLVVPDAERFDLEDGDAILIDEQREHESYDCVHSSHCLEHMFDPADAIMRWWKLIKPGDHLAVVVPDEDLYEQGLWPGIFNSNHKATFRLTKSPDTSWSPVSYNIETLARALPANHLVLAERQNRHYNHYLLRLGYGNQRSMELRRQCEGFLVDLGKKGMLNAPMIDEL